MFHNTHFQGFVWGSQELISRRAAVAAESETTPGKLIKKSRLQMESPNDRVPGQNADPTKKALFEAGFVAESVWQTFTNKKIQHRRMDGLICFSFCFDAQTQP